MVKKTNKTLILLDIDGVISNDVNRIHLALQGKWDDYYDGMLSDGVLEKGRELYETYINDPNVKVGYLTARKEDRRDTTTEWLKSNRFSPTAPLYMRPMDNDKPIAEFKAQVVLSMRFVYNDVVLYDDDPAIVDYIKNTVGSNNAVLCTWSEKPEELQNNG